MRDRIVTASSQAFLLNGDRHALHVACDHRSRPVRLALVRKSDQRILLHCRPDGRRIPAGVGRPPLPRDAGKEFACLLRRLRSAGAAGRRLPPSADASRRIDGLLRQLRVDADIVRNYRPGRCREPGRLEQAGRDLHGRPLWLVAGTKSALARLRHAALADGVRIVPVSGFRSIDYQARLIAAKLRRGRRLEQILAVNALPGYSEHHLGTTVDLHDGDGPALEESFENTAAFRWLQANAGRFGFGMSYPHDNPWGIAYEPWHWRHRSAPSGIMP